jgi:hypothetical protein
MTDCALTTYSTIFSRHYDETESGVRCTFFERHDSSVRGKARAITLQALHQCVSESSTVCLSVCLSVCHTHPKATRTNDLPPTSPSPPPPPHWVGAVHIR